MHATALCDTLPFVTDSENARRLGAAIRDRRDYLGLTAGDLGARVGLAAGSIYAIERGRAPRRSSRVALERELYWGQGSCDAVLEGGDPIVLPEPSVRAVELSPSERLVLDELHRLTEDDQRFMQRSFIALIRTRLDDGNL